MVSPSAAVAASASASATAVEASVTPAASEVADGEDVLGGKLEQKNKTRCWTCKKKVGLTGFECRCSYVFCGKVRCATGGSAASAATAHTC